jgi:uncharacterized protein YerC
MKLLNEALKEQRLKYKVEVTRLLAQTDPVLKYREISAATGVSLITIVRLAKMLGIKRKCGRPRKLVNS